MTNTSNFRTNKWAFGVGTLGRDMVYTAVSMYLIFFLTEVIDLDDARLWWASTLMLATRLFDAVTDIMMGQIVDNTHTRYGPYKPWIAAGAIGSAVCTLLLFADLAEGWAYVGVFTLTYFVWSIMWTMNDIPFWALLPALSIDQHKREQAGAIAKTVAAIGLFSVVIGILPLTAALETALGSARLAWLVFIAALVVLMVIFQAVTLICVKTEPLAAKQPTTSMRGLWRALIGNDQLMWVSLAMVVFQIGFITTTSFGAYFFKYAYRDEGAYSMFALVLAVGQLSGFALFPWFAKRFTRKNLYLFATVLIVAGYLLFYFSPMNIIVLSIAGLPMFFGDAFVVMLMLMFLSDTIEYGHWKLHRRHTALTFSLQPFINKVGGAVGTQIVAMTAIWSGINQAATPADVSAGGIWLMKSVMILLPLALILVGFAIFWFKYTIDERTYARIVADLRKRGDLV